MTAQEQQTHAPSGPVAPAGVNHLVLNVRNMERAHDFWTRMLGFRQVGEMLPRPNGPRLWMRFYQAAGGSHHDLALAEVNDGAAQPEAQPWSMIPNGPGINHVAITWPDREAWLQQIAWMQSQGVRFQAHIEHGMTHSVYVADPDGHGIEVLYELPREVWEDDIAAALTYAKLAPTEGPAALTDNTEYKVFRREGE